MKKYKDFYVFYENYYIGIGVGQGRPAKMSLKAFETSSNGT